MSQFINDLLSLQVALSQATSIIQKMVENQSEPKAAPADECDLFASLQQQISQQNAANVAQSLDDAISEAFGTPKVEEPVVVADENDLEAVLRAQVLEASLRSQLGDQEDYDHDDYCSSCGESCEGCEDEEEEEEYEDEDEDLTYTLNQQIVQAKFNAALADVVGQPIVSSNSEAVEEDALTASLLRQMNGEAEVDEEEALFQTLVEQVNGKFPAIKGTENGEEFSVDAGDLVVYLSHQLAQQNVQVEINGNGISILVLEPVAAEEEILEKAVEQDSLTEELKSQLLTSHLRKQLEFATV